MPYEPAAYSLSDADGNVLGLAAIHVDDLIWTGTTELEEITQKVCQEFRFGKLQKVKMTSSIVAETSKETSRASTLHVPH